MQGMVYPLARYVLMKRLVVNGDDFGMTESVNQGILEAHRRGILTSTTVLANGTAFDSAVALASGAPALGVGVHLNLTDGRPVSDPARVSTLVDSAGNFSGGPATLLKRMLRRRVNLAEVERELDAQIQRVRSAGIDVTHLDGHKHVHMLPGIFAVVVNLARKHGIPGIRCAAERRLSFWTLLRHNGSSMVQVMRQSVAAGALTWVAPGLRARLAQAGLAYPMYFYGVMQTGFLDAASLGAILRDLPAGTSELMCHPGYVDSALRRSGTRLVAQRETELAALTRPEITKLVATLGIQLIDYRGLCRV